MADIDRYKYAYDRLKDASRSYDEIMPNCRGRYIQEGALIAIGHFLKMLVDSSVKFKNGNITQGE